MHINYEKLGIWISGILLVIFFLCVALCGIAVSVQGKPAEDAVKLKYNTPDAPAEGRQQYNITVPPDLALKDQKIELFFFNPKTGRRIPDNELDTWIRNLHYSIIEYTNETVQKPVYEMKDGRNEFKGYKMEKKHVERQKPVAGDSLKYHLFKQSPGAKVTIEISGSVPLRQSIDIVVGYGGRNYTEFAIINNSWSTKQTLLINNTGGQAKYNELQIVNLSNINRSLCYDMKNFTDLRVVKNNVTVIDHQIYDNETLFFPANVSANSISYDYEIFCNNSEAQGTSKPMVLYYESFDEISDWVNTEGALKQDAGTKHRTGYSGYIDKAGSLVNAYIPFGNTSPKANEVVLEWFANPSNTPAVGKEYYFWLDDDFTPGDQFDDVGGFGYDRSQAWGNSNHTIVHDGLKTEGKKLGGSTLFRRFSVNVTGSYGYYYVNETPMNLISPGYTSNWSSFWLAVKDSHPVRIDEIVVYNSSASKKMRQYMDYSTVKFGSSTLFRRPNASDVRILPVGATGLDNLSCNYTYSDPDGHPEQDVFYKWYNNGTLNISWTNATLESDFINDNQKIKCGVVVQDATGYNSTQYNSSEIVVGDFNAPSLSNTTFNLTPANPARNAPVGIYGQCSDDNSGADFLKITIELPSGTDVNRTMTVGIAPTYNLSFINTGASGTYLVKKAFCQDKSGNLNETGLNLSFSVPSPSSGRSGGGGGGGESEEVFRCDIQGKNWTLTTTQGAKSMDIKLHKDPDQERCVSYMVRNFDTEAVTLNFSCIDAGENLTEGVCRHVNISRPSIRLEPNAIRAETGKLCVRAPPGGDYGDTYYFSLKATDSDTCSIILSSKATVSRLASFFKVFTIHLSHVKPAWSDAEIPALFFSIPIGFVFFVVPILILRRWNFLVGVLTGLFLGTGVFFLIQFVI